MGTKKFRDTLAEATQAGLRTSETSRGVEAIISGFSEGRRHRLRRSFGFSKAVLLGAAAGAISAAQFSSPISAVWAESE